MPTRTCRISRAEMAKIERAIDDLFAGAGLARVGADDDSGAMFHFPIVTRLAGHVAMEVEAGGDLVFHQSMPEAVGE
jgi:hypothetical protein